MPLLENINSPQNNNLNSAVYKSLREVFASAGETDEFSVFGTLTAQVSGGTTYDIEIYRALQEDLSDAVLVAVQDETERAANYDAEGFAYWQIKVIAVTGGPITLGLTFRES